VEQQLPKIPPHIDWLKPTGEVLKTTDGTIIELWELRHTKDDHILSQWATHFRSHYCSDDLIDALRGVRSRTDYLTNIKFPSLTGGLGPSIRAGDFAEILVADFLQWVRGYTVPRVRWNCKVVRDESSKGSDVIGFYFETSGAMSSKDTLAVFESKTGFSATSANRLQDAIDHSAKDHLRIDESLNYIKQRLLEGGQPQKAQEIERFQNPVDAPYKEVHGAAALYSNDVLDLTVVSAANTMTVPAKTKGGQLGAHPKRDHLVLILIKGEEMMALVHELYRRAADEA
jgi:hypothetical protein